MLILAASTIAYTVNAFVTDFIRAPGMAHDSIVRKLIIEEFFETYSLNID